jgi:serine/threonine-protein kinase
MGLAPGTRLGPYEIVSALGAGGMGEVYRATDTTLKRAVAIKVLPESVATDPERLARFQREAEVLAALNHPNIAHLHGVERAGGAFALVMELVEGPTLADRIATGRIPWDEALPIARQIAEALEAAHEQRIVHRDLKPANVKVRDDGTVKVLDFGLAKALDPAAPAPNGSQPPTITTPAMTQAGVVLGTAAYMSPEQARGKTADKRSDVWSFGCVLYEMLTGRRAFAGEDVADTLAAVLRTEPDWYALGNEAPAAVLTLLRKCLDKNPRSRISDLAAARFVFDSPDLVPGAPASRRPWRTVATVAVVLLAAGAIGIPVWRSFRPAASQASVVRFVIPLPPDQNLTGPASGLPLLDLSPDGEHLVYAANGRLYHRPMAEGTPQPIGGTNDRAEGPTFSPDGQSIAFFTRTSDGSGTPSVLPRGVIKRVRLTGGPATTLCESTYPFGISWGADGIVFGEAGKGVMRVSAEGGEPEVLVPMKEDEIAMGPRTLPGGRAVLFTHRSDLKAILQPQQELTDLGGDQSRIIVQSLTNGERQTLIEGGTDGRYAPTGHIVYLVGGILRAVPFDVSRLMVSGAAAPLIEGVARTRLALTFTGSAHFAMSATGALAYIAGPASTASAPPRDLGLYERGGAPEPFGLPPKLYEFPRVSPNGEQIAVSTSPSDDRNVWVYDLRRKTPPRQLTFQGRNRSPIWSADGRAIAFQSDREGDLAIFTQPADGSRAAERLTRPEPDAAHVPQAWSRNGDYMLLSVETRSGFSLATLAARDRKVEGIPELESTAIIPAAVFSPDGRWIAYQSGDTRISKVFVQPFPPTGARYAVVDGRHPRWSNDGTELFVSQGPQIHAVPVNTQSMLTWGSPTLLIQGIPLGGTQRNYDVLADGKQFVGLTVAAGYTPGTAASIRQIDVVLNWFTELQQRVPTR